MYGTSYSYFKKEVTAHLKTLAPSRSRVLDVGAGAGIYGQLLNDYYILEAVDVFKPTVDNLRTLPFYEDVFLSDIRSFTYPSQYEIIIMGDVIEHLSVEDTQKVISLARENCNHLMVAIPYQYKQNSIYGNDAEIHIQDDLTKELFDERYPDFELLFGNDSYGYYLWSRK